MAEKSALCRRPRDCNSDELWATQRSRRLLALHYCVSVKHKCVAIRRGANPSNTSPMYKWSILAKDVTRFLAGAPSCDTRLCRPARAQLQYGAVTYWGGDIIGGSAKVARPHVLRDFAYRGDYS